MIYKESNIFETHADRHYLKLYEDYSLHVALKVLN